MPDKMTLHRALAELKLIDSKIKKKIEELRPIGLYQRGKLIDNHITGEQFKVDAESTFQSIKDLINRKIKIKSAIVEANSTTKVMVGSQEMTISDAITMKSVIELKKLLEGQLSAYQRTALANLNKNNETVEKNVQSLLVAALGKDSTQSGSEKVEGIRKPYVEANEFLLFDPLNIKEKMDELNEEISDFVTEVDAALSEINATTFITVD